MRYNLSSRIFPANFFSTHQTSQHCHRLFIYSRLLHLEMYVDLGPDCDVNKFWLWCYVIFIMSPIQQLALHKYSIVARRKKTKNKNHNRSTQIYKCIAWTEGDDCISLFVWVQLSLFVHDKHIERNTWNKLLTAFEYAIRVYSTLIKQHFKCRL